MNKNILVEQWKREEQYAFSGWDFSHLKGRWEDEQLSWDYKELVLSYLKHEHKLLDMGTGGGEFLLDLNHAPSRCSITENYPPNLQLCLQRLAPLGIEVAQSPQDILPFADQTFDIVLNRHESFSTGEVHRVLKQGGIFITQQIGSKNDEDLVTLLLGQHSVPFPENTLKNTVAQLQKQGFEVTFAKEEFTPIHFYDVGALVFFAKIIPWEFVGFGVDRCIQQLLELQKIVESQGYIEGTEHRFVVVAMKK